MKVFQMRSGRSAAMAVAALAAGTLTFGEAQAASVYDTPADLTGNRTVGNGLTTTDSAWDDVEISWDITNHLNGTYTYTYTIADLTDPQLSHLVLDITPDALDEDSLADPDAFVNPTVNGSAWNDIEFNEDGFPQESGIVGAVKFDELDFDTNPLVFEFQSNRAPVWGHIFLKGGQVDLFNTAYDSVDDAVLSNVQNFVARPNSEGVIIPLPAAVWGGLALFGALGVGQRIRSRRLSESV